MKNRVFFPQAALDQWIAEERVDLRNDELTIKAENRKYRIIEAVRILSEVTGQPDVNELVGKVKSRAFLTELGAELLEGSVILGDNAYDAVPGFVGAPVGTFADHRKQTPQSEMVTRTIKNDEDLLAELLIRKL
ncbi:MAG: hypothetical protein IPK82_00330 [Polyangiaceae bacterium]|nr:hypothetical protein [Polyangiaceae bacterium]